jgi:hypothetical protein
LGKISQIPNFQKFVDGDVEPAALGVSGHHEKRLAIDVFRQPDLTRNVHLLRCVRHFFDGAGDAESLHT